jgi:hypothetical protein
MEFTVYCQPHATRWRTINTTKLTIELRTREERRLIRAQVIVACGLLPHVTAREEVVSSIAVVHGQDGGRKSGWGMTRKALTGSALRYGIPAP